MAMIKCPECGKEISDLAETCPNCGFPIGFQSASTPLPQSSSNTANGSPYQNVLPYPQNQPVKVHAVSYEKEGNSWLGLLALLSSFLGFTFILSAIIAIIDLCRTDNRKKTFSIIALCICGFWLLIGTVGLLNKDKATNTTANKITSSDIQRHNTNTSNITPDIDVSVEEDLPDEKILPNTDFPQDATKLPTGTYIIGEDLEPGKYDFYASKGTGSLKVYKSYDDYKSDEYGFDAFMEFDILTNGASVGLLNEDVYTDTVSHIKLANDWCLIIDKGLELRYQASESIDEKILSVGTYIVGEDISVGKYDFTAITGSGSVKLYNSYDEYLEDEYGIHAFEDYDMKEENASVGMLNEDVYTESVNNIRLDDGQCLVIEKGLKLEYHMKQNDTASDSPSIEDEEIKQTDKEFDSLGDAFKQGFEDNFEISEENQKNIDSIKESANEIWNDPDVQNAYEDYKKSLEELLGVN